MVSKPNNTNLQAMLGWEFFCSPLCPDRVFFRHYADSVQQVLWCVGGIDSRCQVISGSCPHLGLTDSLCLSLMLVLIRCQTRWILTISSCLKFAPEQLTKQNCHRLEDNLEAGIIRGTRTTRSVQQLINKRLFKRDYISRTFSYSSDISLSSF